MSNEFTTSEYELLYAHHTRMHTELERIEREKKNHIG